MADTELRERCARAAWQASESSEERWEDQSGWRREMYLSHVDAIFSEARDAGYVIAKLEGTVNEMDRKPEPPKVVA